MVLFPCLAPKSSDIEQRPRRLAFHLIAQLSESCLDLHCHERKQKLDAKKDEKNVAQIFDSKHSFNVCHKPREARASVLMALLGAH